MESEEQKQRRLEIQIMKEIRENYRRKLQSTICANSEVQLKTDSLEFSLTNCGNQKKYNSKYCQECSDNHKKEHGK